MHQGLSNTCHTIGAPQAILFPQKSSRGTLRWQSSCAHAHRMHCDESMTTLLVKSPTTIRFLVVTCIRLPLCAHAERRRDAAPQPQLRCAMSPGHRPHGEEDDGRGHCGRMRSGQHGRTHVSGGNPSWARTDAQLQGDRRGQAGPAPGAQRTAPGRCHLKGGGHYASATPGGQGLVLASTGQGGRRVHRQNDMRHESAAWYARSASGTRPKKMRVPGRQRWPGAACPRTTVGRATATSAKGV